MSELLALVVGMAFFFLAGYVTGRWAEMSHQEHKIRNEINELINKL